MKYLILLFLCVTAVISIEQDQPDEEPQYYCGRNLLETMKRVCSKEKGINKSNDLQQPVRCEFEELITKSF